MDFLEDFFFFRSLLWGLRIMISELLLDEIQQRLPIMSPQPQSNFVIGISLGQCVACLTGKSRRHANGAQLKGIRYWQSYCTKWLFWAHVAQFSENLGLVRP